MQIVENPALEFVSAIGWSTTIFFDDLNDDISITDRRCTHNDIFTHLTKKKLTFIQWPTTKKLFSRWWESAKRFRLTNKY
jgi:hypothetical protein